MDEAPCSNASSHPDVERLFDDVEAPGQRDWLHEQAKIGMFQWRSHRLAVRARESRQGLTPPLNSDAHADKRSQSRGTARQRKVAPSKSVNVAPRTTSEFL